jgi:hypothetical protein
MRRPIFSLVVPAEPLFEGSSTFLAERNCQLPNGDEYTCRLVNGVPDGGMVYQFRSGDLVVGVCRAGVPVGTADVFISSLKRTVSVHWSQQRSVCVRILHRLVQLVCPIPDLFVGDVVRLHEAVMRTVGTIELVS